MGKKFGALAEFRQAQIETPEKSSVDKLSQVIAAPEPTKGRGRPTGKRSNPEYEPTTVLLRKQTKRKTFRLLEDIESEYDVSELIEMLLVKWISEHT